MKRRLWLWAWFVLASLGTLAPHAESQTLFRRGDINGDGLFDAVAEAAYLSEALFGGGPAPQCADAADVNDDGLLDVTDILVVLQFGLVPGSPPIEAPYPDCGLDPTADSLGCDRYVTCASFAPPTEDSSYVLAVGDLV
ncbi:MAG: hypothetical protein KDC38_12020, partial [Planctomycetes bacterium]|nr:hypothetical protein [Planctomycetota bacterium]